MSKEDAKQDAAQRSVYEEVAKQHNTQKTVYELLCQCVSQEQAKHLDRYLKDHCRGEENSYPFLHGLLSVTQLRLGINLPVAVAKKVAEPLDEFREVLWDFLDEIKVCQTFLKRKRTRHKSFWDWPLGKQYNNKLAIWSQVQVEWFEELFAHRARWIVLLSILTASAFFLRLAHAKQLELGRIGSQLALEATTRQQLEMEHDAQVIALKEAETARDAAVAETSELRKQHLATLEQKSDELAKAKLQKLEPWPYHLAQQLQRVSRRIKLPDGSFGWEIKIHEAPGFPFFHIVGEQDFTQTAVLYVKEQEGRIDLSATAPSVLPTEHPQSKGKSRQ